MARFMVGAKTTNGGTSTLPAISLYNTAAVVAKIREIGLFNTTNTATDKRLVILTAAGTPGTALTETAYDSGSGAAVATGFNSHSAGTPIGSDGGYRASLGAAIGAGVIWTYGDTGLRTAKATSDGFGLAPADGATGQVLQAYFVWDE